MDTTGWVTVIASISAAAVAIITALRISHVGTKVDEVKEKAEQATVIGGEVKTGIAEIHVLVNSRMSEAVTKIAILEERIAGITKLPVDIAAAKTSAADASKTLPGPRLPQP